jgi:hypothetical protein
MSTPSLHDDEERCAHGGGAGALENWRRSSSLRVAPATPAHRLHAGLASERLIPIRTGTGLAQRASTLSVLAALRDGFQKRCLL